MNRALASTASSPKSRSTLTVCPKVKKPSDKLTTVHVSLDGRRNKAYESARPVHPAPPACGSATSAQTPPPHVRQNFGRRCTKTSRLRSSLVHLFQRPILRHGQLSYETQLRVLCTCQSSCFGDKNAYWRWHRATTIRKKALDVWNRVGGRNVCTIDYVGDRVFMNGFRY